MSVPELKVQRLGDTASESIFKFKDKRSPLDYSKSIAHLIIEHSVHVDKAPRILEDLFQQAWDAQSGDSQTEYYIPKLPTEVVQLFSHFAWYSEDDGTHAVYVRNSVEVDTYVLTQDVWNTASSITISGRSLEENMTDYYLVLANKNALPFLNTDDKEKDGSIKVSKRMPLPSLQEYWEVHIEKYWKRDSRFRLPHRPLEITMDPNTPAFFHWDSSRIQPGPHPAWDGWMLSFPEWARKPFRAWIASVLDPENKGRQALWMQDQGYSGKSTVQRVLARFMGKHAVGSISHGSLGNQFGYASIYGKRLVIYGDNKNPKLLHTEKIHSMLGGDIVTIERKNVAPFTAPIHCKLWINANGTPEVDLGARSEVTRLLYIPLQDPPEETLRQFCMLDASGNIKRQKDGTPVYIGGSLEEKLWPELPHFLHTCQQDYLELCPNRKDIALSEEMWEALQSRCPSPEHIGVERFVGEELEIGEDFSVKPGDLQEVFSQWCKGKSNSFDMSRLRTYLETQHGCHMEGRTRDKPRLLVGVRLKPVGTRGGIKV